MTKKSALIQVVPTAPPSQEMSLFERVQEFLVDKEWEFRSNEERGYFSLNLRLRDGSVRVVIDTSENENWSRILVYVIYPTLVPELKRHEISETIARINYVHLASQLQLDLDDGELRARCIIESDSVMGDIQIDRALRRATDMAEQFQAALLSVAFGNTEAKDILKLGGQDPSGLLQ